MLQIGRLILMMMLLLLVVLAVLRSRESSPDIHEAALSMVERSLSLSNGTEHLDLYLKVYAEYVVAQQQKILYLRLNGQEISSERIQEATCNRTRIFSEEIPLVRAWWLQLIVPKVPGVNNVTSGATGQERVEADEFQRQNCLPAHQ